MNYHVEFQGKILKNMDFIKYLVSYVFFWTTVYISRPPPRGTDRDMYRLPIERMISISI